MAKGTITVAYDSCKGCGLCTTVCPQSILTLDPDHLNVHGYHPAALVDPDSICTGCALCALVCPDVCITVYRTPVRRAAV
jgi:2-oxoglutarate ferredoxin oxidoreductase subunit delta